jgi:3-oxoacyl-[acyl-carrier-protein] synthase-3
LPTQRGDLDWGSLINMKNIRANFVATGSYIPERSVDNLEFAEFEFADKNGELLLKENTEIISKFKSITGISKRCYAGDAQRASDLGVLAAEDALRSSGIDRETIDYIIVAHNFGDVSHGSNRVEQVPSLATRVKHGLKIRNANCVAYDLIFGCPGWLEGVIQASYFIRSGDAKRCLIIGTETLSRVSDPHDRDSMIYSDGSGAIIMEATTENKGILAHRTQTHAGEEATFLNVGPSYDTTGKTGDNTFIKMNGRKLYEFALTHVPLVVKSVLDKSGLHLKDIKKVLIHQANEKMDFAILKRLFNLYGYEEFDEQIMPMTISWLGNSSVATIPTMLDLIMKGKMEHEINPGDKVVLASVGAGMNINAVVYQF